MTRTIRTLVLLSAFAGIVSGCMIPPHKYPKGFSSTYRKHLIEQERYETSQPQSDVRANSRSRRLFYKRPSQRDLTTGMNESPDPRGMSKVDR